ncbi:MAG: hypothetical protein JRJ56_06480, partial [Deltaproteobacteria bacterium]|nr:hypothetical protein [Deltaproteobacteria bacterium]
AMCGEEEPRQVMNEIMAFAVESLPAIVELFHRYAAEQEEKPGGAVQPRLRLVRDEGGRTKPAKTGSRASGKGRQNSGRVVALDDFRRSDK